jgi:hypothetical protein
MRLNGAKRLLGQWQRTQSRSTPSPALEALADKMDRVCSDRFGEDWNVPF